jgi:hypothetical protein
MEPEKGQTSTKPVQRYGEIKMELDLSQEDVDSRDEILTRGTLFMGIRKLFFFCVLGKPKMTPGLTEDYEVVQVIFKL